MPDWLKWLIQKVASGVQQNRGPGEDAARRAFDQGPIPMTGPKVPAPSWLSGLGRQPVAPQPRPKPQLFNANDARLQAYKANRTLQLGRPYQGSPTGNTFRDRGR